MARAKITSYIGPQGRDEEPVASGEPEQPPIAGAQEDDETDPVFLSARAGLPLNTAWVRDRQRVTAVKVAPRSSSMHQRSETRSRNTQPRVTPGLPPDTQLIEEWRAVADLWLTDAHWEAKWKPDRDAVINQARTWYKR